VSTLRKLKALAKKMGATVELIDRDSGVTLYDVVSPWSFVWTDAGNRLRFGLERGTPEANRVEIEGTMEAMGYGLKKDEEGIYTGNPHRPAHTPTLRQINAELQARGIPGELVKGAGYFYMIDSNENPGGDYTWFRGVQSIYVYSLKSTAGSGWDVDTWANEVEELYKQNLEEG